MTPEISKAVEAAGGIRALSRLLGISQSAISQWRHIPDKRIIEIERVTGVPREELRPDLYRKPQAPMHRVRLVG